MLKIKRLEYGSLLSYSSGLIPSYITDDSRIKYSKKIMSFLKNERYVKDANDPNGISLPFSQWVANDIASSLTTLPFSYFFGEDTILIPVPKSSLMQPNTLWVPLNIANALVKNHLASKVVSALERVKPVTRSSSVPAEYRPKAEDHYNSIEVKEKLLSAQKIVLIDDIITRGSTLIGAVNKLFDVFPDKEFYAFAVMRTISNPQEFGSWHSPVKGEITLREDGETFRRP